MTVLDQDKFFDVDFHSFIVNELVKLKSMGQIVNLLINESNTTVELISLHEFQDLIDKLWVVRHEKFELRIHTLLLFVFGQTVQIKHDDTFWKVWFFYLLQYRVFFFNIFALYLLCIWSVLISPNSEEIVSFWRIIFLVVYLCIIDVKIIRVLLLLFNFSYHFENPSYDKVLNFFILNQLNLFVHNFEFIMFQNVNDYQLRIKFNKRLNVRIDFFKAKIS